MEELDSCKFFKVPESDSTSEKKSSWFFRSMKSVLFLAVVVAAAAVVVVVLFVVVAVVGFIFVEGPVVFACSKFWNADSKSSSNSNSSSLWRFFRRFLPNFRNDPASVTKLK
jgi:ABC-type phosphate transport system permease subunit